MIDDDDDYSVALVIKVYGTNKTTVTIFKKLRNLFLIFILQNTDLFTFQ